MARPKAPPGETQAKILDTLRADRVASVGALSKKLGLSRQMVSAHIRHLLHAGKVSRVEGVKLYRAT